MKNRKLSEALRAAIERDIEELDAKEPLAVEAAPTTEVSGVWKDCPNCVGGLDGEKICANCKGSGRVIIL